MQLPEEARAIDLLLGELANHVTAHCEAEGAMGTDTVYTLLFSVIMINTDLHNGNARRKVCWEWSGSAT